MWPKSNLLKDVQAQFKLDLIERFENQEIEIFADYVFEEFCNLNRIDRIVKTDYRLSESEIVKISQAVKKINSFMPIQYVVSKAYFYGLSYFVNQTVLIPRPETEELVSWVNESVRVKEHGDILDIGTGSGCISVSIAKMNNKCRVSAIDISKESLSIAERNADYNHVNIRFIEGDALDSKSLPDEKFDLIVSNPPYVRQSEKYFMKSNVLDYEPSIALFVTDENPLIYYKSISEFAVEHLIAGGELFFEINEAFANELVGLLNSLGFIDVKIKFDFRGKPRFIKGVRK